MSKSEANLVDDECGGSGLNSSDNRNCPPIPGSSTTEVNLEENIIPKKRSKPPEKLNFTNKGKEKSSKNSKRKNSIISESLSEKSKEKSNVPRVQMKKRMCQSSQSSSALFQSSSGEHSNQRMKLHVPNIDGMTASTSRNHFDMENQSNNSVQRSTVKCTKKRRPIKRKKPSSETINTKDDALQVEEIQRKNRENLEEELRCSICSEIFICAVTLNCSHSFCKYCIMQWRKNNDTCPICRQIITSQNSTLVLDKCIERILETSDEKMKENRQNLIACREEHLDDSQPVNANNNGEYNNGLPDIDGSPNSVDDEWNVGSEWILSDHSYDGFIEDGDENEILEDFYDFQDYSGEEYLVDLHENNDEDFVYQSEGENDSDEVEEEEETNDYPEEEEYEEEYDYTSEEDSESEIEDGDIENKEGDSCEESDDEDSEGSVGRDYGNKCFNCGLSGHFARRCPTRVAYTGLRGAYYGGYGNCFKCNGEGHWANGCPNQ